MLDVQQSFSRRIIHDKQEEDVNSILMRHQEEPEAVFPEYDFSNSKKMNNEIAEVLRNTMVYCGEIGIGCNNTDLPTRVYRAGHTYKIKTNSKVKCVGIECYDGDLVTAINSFSGEFKNSDWAVLRATRCNSNKPGIINSNIAESRQVIIGKDDPSKSVYINALPENNMSSGYLFDKNVYGYAKVPIQIGNSVRLPISDDASIMAALKELAGLPSTDPYVENKLKRDDSAIETQEVDVNALRGYFAEREYY